MVFQDYALFPHMTALENVAFGLHRLSPQERATRASEALALVGLVELAKRYPHQLSGGQQQRVALARALAPRPPVVLLDEPFSNLDAALRDQMRGELRDILRRADATAVFVTHDQGEALALGDRIALLRAGRLEQIGAPDALFQQPRSRFVAGFMGQADFLPARATDTGLLTEIGRIPQRVALPVGAQVDVLVRYDDLTLVQHPAGESRVVDRVYEGQTYTYIVALPSGTRVRCKTSHVQRYSPGAPVHVSLLNDHPLICFVGMEAVETQPLSEELAH
jgi:iron(III) transport system ATP-binding protein